MVMLAAIIPSLEKGMQFTALDMKDVYFYINIHLANRRFLSTHHFQCRVLPFGVVTAPIVFTKVISITVAYFRLYGVLVFLYVDRWFLAVRSRQEAHKSTSMLLNLLSSFGVSINLEKSILDPMYSLDFIGATISLVIARAYLTCEQFWRLMTT